MRNRTNLRIGIAAIGLVLASVANQTWGLTLQEILPRLDAEDLTTREGATDDLIRLLKDDSDAACIERARSLEREAAETLRTQDLTLEQRIRLTDALRRRFFSTARGAMGVQFQQPQQVLMGVELARVIEGFPAGEAGVLKPGDVVTSVAGVSLLDPDLARFRANGTTAGSERLRFIVISHDPGDTVEMTLIRPIILPDGRQAPRNPAPGVQGVPGAGAYITEGPGKNADLMTVKVPLGSFERLQQGNLLDRGTLEGAWQERARRLGIPSIEARRLHSPLTIADWNAHPRSSHGPGPKWLQAGNAQSSPANAMANALSNRAIQQQVRIQQVPIPADQRPNRAQRTVVRNRAGEPPAAGAERREVRAEGQPAEPAGGFGELANLMQNIALLTQRRDNLLQRASDITASDKARRAAAVEASEIQELITAIEASFKRRVEEQGLQVEQAQPRP